MFKLIIKINNTGNCLLNHIALCGNGNANGGTSRMLHKVIDEMRSRRIDIDIRNFSGYSALLLAIQADNYLSAFILLKVNY